MEQQYQKAIHHISTLIINHQYERASNILQFMMQSGFINSQIFVMQSYCIKMTKGVSSAIVFLKQTCQQGPMISFTISQYYKQLNEMKYCQIQLKKIEDTKENRMSEKCSLVQQILKNLHILLQNEQRPPLYLGKYGQIDTSSINQVNDIVGKYKKNRLNQKEVKSQLLRVLQERLVCGRLKQHILKFVRYLEYEIKSKQKFNNIQADL